VAIQDTTEINFAGASGRRRGFGPAGGDGNTPGFFIHPVIAVDMDTEALIGLVNAQIWTRSSAPASDRKKRLIKDKESLRWIEGCDVAAEVLSQAAAVTMISDREGDIYGLFARRPASMDLIIRAGQNRALDDATLLFDALAQAPVLTRQTVRVSSRGPGDKGREAHVEIRARNVRIRCPKNGMRETNEPPFIDLVYVEAREIDAPDPKTVLLWRLLTTHAVGTAEEAAQTVHLYRLRWRIEQLFRALKSDGLRLGESQVSDVKRMFALAAIALAGAVRTIQLIDARHGSERPATDIVDASFIAPLDRLSRKLEGKTERQKNSHPRGSLAWLAWIIARLGGWNCYYKPPGPKTMRDGWTQLATFLAGYAFATQTEANV